MGCILGRHCDPGAPDSSVRHMWHIDGVVIDHDGDVDRRRGGLVFILDGAVCYRPRRLDCRKTGGPLRVDIASISSTSRTADYPNDKDAAKGAHKREMVTIEVKEEDDRKNVAFISRNSEKLHTELSDIIHKHRHKPKIIQFNSVDIDGVEIDLPS